MADEYPSREVTGDPLPSLGLLEGWSLDLKLVGSQSCLLLPVFWSGRTVHNWSSRPVWASTPLHDLSFLEVPEIGSQQTKEGRERPGSRAPGGGAVSNPSLYTGAACGQTMEKPPLPPWVLFSREETDISAAQHVWASEGTVCNGELAGNGV